MARVNELTSTAIILEVMEVGGALKGKRVSITGHLGRPRKDIVSIIERAEGRYDETPKCGTTYLVTNRDWTAKTQEKGASLREEVDKLLRSAISIIPLIDVWCKR
jgi:hypothetical protein